MIKKYARFSLLFIVFIAHFALFALVNYAFPHYDEVFITGGEVKRMDKDGLIGADNPADGPTRDVYFIYTKSEGSDKVMPYRNEDTRWGFPFYFKFNSADLQAKAISFSASQTPVRVQVRYYGWRIAMFDAFRNATSIKELKAGQTRDNPIMAWVFYAAVFISLMISSIFINKFFEPQKSL